MTVLNRLLLTYTYDIDPERWTLQSLGMHWFVETLRSATPSHFEVLHMISGNRIRQ